MPTMVEKKVARISECFPRLRELAPNTLMELLTKTFIANGKYRALPLYKMRRLYDLIVFYLWGELHSGKFCLDRAKKEFPGVVHSITEERTVTSRILKNVYVEVDHVENNS